MATDYKFVVSWSFAPDDVRQCSFGFVAEAAAAEGTVEIAFDTLWEGLKQGYKPSCVLATYTWYEGRTGTPPNIKWGDAFRIIGRSIAGIATGANFQLPPQCAMVVTLNLQDASLKRHRGRVYLPAPSTYWMSDTGRIVNPGLLADYFKTFLDTCKTNGFTPVVHGIASGLPISPQIGQVRVDNVFDTQRRRGYNESTETQNRTLA